MLASRHCVGSLVFAAESCTSENHQIIIFKEEERGGGKLQVNFKFLSNSWQQEKTGATICQLQIKGDPRNNNLTKKQDYFTEILSQD